MYHKSKSNIHHLDSSKAFTISSYMKNKKIAGPNSSGALSPSKEVKPSEFRRFYERGDFPLCVEHDTRGNKILWKTDIDSLDLHHYLPLFFDGIREIHYPYSFLATQGITDLLKRGGSKILPVIPQLIIPLKKALNTRNPTILCRTLKAIKMLVLSHETIGEALVPYYRQLLPMLNAFRFNNGDGIEYSQFKDENLGDLIRTTLELLEKNGGEDAFINIKYMIPSYESCVLN